MARGYSENCFPPAVSAHHHFRRPLRGEGRWPLRKYAEFYPWNRTHHSFIEIFNGLYETSVSEYGAGALVFFDCYAFKFQFHTVRTSQDVRFTCAL